MSPQVLEVLCDPAMGNAERRVPVCDSILLCVPGTGRVCPRKKDVAWECDVRVPVKRFENGSKQSYLCVPESDLCGTERACPRKGSSEGNVASECRRVSPEVGREMWRGSVACVSPEVGRTGGMCVPGGTRGSGKWEVGSAKK